MSKERQVEEEDETTSADEASEAEGGADAALEAERPDPNTPRNRAERRMQARAARRGRTAQLSDVADEGAQDGEGAPLDPDGGLMEPTTSMGGNPRALAESAGGPGRPKVPPRTMSRGTGTVEGVPEWARTAGDWLAERRGVLTAGVLVVLVAVGGALGYQKYSQSKENRAADAYSEALQVATAPIEAEPENAEQSSNRPPGPRFRTFEARLQASVEKFRQVERNFPQSRIAPVARLNEANALFLLGRYQEARQLFEGLRGADTAGLEGRVVEGIAHAYESLGNLDAAERTYRELQDVQGGTFRDEAQYSLARLALRRDQAARARELLHGVVERTRRATAADPTAAIQQELRERSVAMLREIDPTDPLVQDVDRQREQAGGDHEHGGNALGGANPMRGLPPELQRQVEEMMRRQRAGGGGRGPGGAAPSAPSGGGR
ncbi:MAG: tetratricopeptide repeat protein [Myxococcales bacterium]|nr:tetratricopeptide repeat protein [Myxococcales bacterium]